MNAYKCSCGNTIYDYGNFCSSDFPMKKCCDDFLFDIKKKESKIVFTQNLIYEKHIQNYNRLYQWIKEIFIEAKVKETKLENINIMNEYISKIKLYTARHEYVITLITRENDSYLGGICNNRYLLVDEDHIRSHDLTDGKFTKETFDDIIKDIAKIEVGFVVFSH